MESVIIESEYGPFHYRILRKGLSKDKPTVLFLHGGSPKSQHTEFWTPILPIIQKHCSPILIDRFGHGQSTGKGGLAANDQMISTIIDSILDMGISRIYLVGRSAGAVFCIRQWQKRRKDIAGLGLIAPGSLKSYAIKLEGYDSKMSVLWDIDDPVVKFENYKLLKGAVPKHTLYTIGEFKEASKTASRETPRSHTPELKAPDLFEEFLKDLFKS